MAVIIIISAENDWNIEERSNSRFLKNILVRDYADNSTVSLGDVYY